MSLEELRDKAFFQNSIDVWIMLCEEKKWDYFDTKSYLKFMDYLFSKGLKIQRFPLCIKESGGMFERGKDKTNFLDKLSKIHSDNASAYTIKLTEKAIAAIRDFTL
ncbi:hypothetical protein [Candidatus Nitrosocosmicus franklandus]|uniref:Uncharacterized protein n=1 Tax=Candidatus Nitrosocosmicus franklandianus TaxID=1798806 RepID=A0A484I5N3_9ARCH|nr:hypothetical protein [Candidatus Nitrosocosmicus franklandus]VFJ12413.1 conserved protein of unknown function [Candidatus Nitrosocosmicus franklandus]